MSDSSRSKSSSSAGGPFRRRGFQLFGLGLQDYIRYFFGGNGSLAIVILILICIFLANEAAFFFPQHHEELKKYRLGGQEYVDYVREAVDRHTEIYSKANISYFAEVGRTSKDEDNILAAFRVVHKNVEKAAEESWEVLDESVDELEVLEKDFEKAVGTDEEAALKGAVAAKKKLVAEQKARLEKEFTAALDGKAAWDMGSSVKKVGSDVREKIRESIMYDIPGAEGDPPYIAGLKEASSAKKKAAQEEWADFKATIKGMQDAVRPMKGLFYELRDIGLANKREISKFDTAHLRRSALLEAAESAETPEAKAEKKAQAEAVDITEPEYAKINIPIYESKEKYQELAGPFQSEMAALMKQLPGNVETDSARENLKIADTLYKRWEEAMEKNEKRIPEWKHDKPYSWPSSIAAFFFGKDWVTNSSWHDFYGLLPLFTGSMLISLIALLVAVPFSVSAAIYVNQLARPKEQNMIKPAIEFIGAIPSVVLGFFGIFVLGEALRELSQVEWLSWVPGFPMAERLNILNAGLLLAFMAAPTIFTLAEDALNNIPQAFTENSLAMGATKLQTVLRVVVPTAISGIIAAVMLGFGRVIGETMVVLLVAGNKIKIPDFSEGIGVVTQPAHTMTGIIAQELGEVDQGSLHWRALFMVGMMLFVISLAVNYTAQKVLKKLQKI